jgi:hypothetical protein
MAVLMAVLLVVVLESVQECFDVIEKHFYCHIKIISVSFTMAPKSAVLKTKQHEFFM